jgi:hypothetical protein
MGRGRPVDICCVERRCETGGVENRCGIMHAKVECMRENLSEKNHTNI